MIQEPTIDPADELVCLGHDEDLAAGDGALTPPIVQTSLFAQESLEMLGAGLAAESATHVYTRGQNPTVEALEVKIARLERGARCKCVASGMAAISATLVGLLETGAHILFVNNTYGPTLQLAQRLASFGVEHDIVLEPHPRRLAEAMRPTTRLVWIESPGTMLCRLVDIRSIAELVREHGALTALDNSWATPLFQKPLELGVDLVIHTATKYLGGHSDVLAGAIVGTADLVEQIFHKGYLLLGGALGPFDAWLVNRGMRTLPARMRQHHADGLVVARFLSRHPKVRQVFHPGVTGDSSLVEEQLRGFSGLFSFELDTESYSHVAGFVNRLQLFRIGVSWGGVESLVISPNRGDNRESLATQGIPPGTIRLSVGLEGAEPLIQDLDQALASF